MRLVVGLLRPKKQILGTEFAGEVVEVGSDVSRFKVGDRVFGFNDEGLQSHAELMLIEQKAQMGLMPEGLDYLHAATSLEGIHYAINFINKVSLQAGQKVLVNGASGGIGSALVQLLKYFSCEITAVTESKNIELVKKLGANRVVDFSQQDFTQLDETFDYVFDSVGKSSFSRCKPLLKPKGVYISSELGRFAQNIFYALLTPLFRGKQVKFPIPLNTQQSINIVTDLIEKGAYESVIDRVYPLDEVPEAFAFVEQGLKTGNVAIRIDHQNT